MDLTPLECMVCSVLLLNGGIYDEYKFGLKMFHLASLPVGEGL